MFDDHSVASVGSNATYLLPSSSIFHENIGIKISSAATASKNVCESNAQCANPSFFVKINASSAKRIDPDLKPIPNRPTFPETCSLSEKPNDNMLFKLERSIPTPSSWTVMQYPSLSLDGFKTYASTSTFVDPHSRSCELSKSSANAPRGHTCDVALPTHTRTEYDVKEEHARSSVRKKKKAHYLERSARARCKDERRLYFQREDTRTKTYSSTSSDDFYCVPSCVYPRSRSSRTTLRCWSLASRPGPIFLCFLRRRGGLLLLLGGRVRRIVPCLASASRCF